MACVVVSVLAGELQLVAVRRRARDGFGANDIARHVGDYLTLMDSNALDTLFRVGESSAGP